MLPKNIETSLQIKFIDTNSSSQQGAPGCVRSGQRVEGERSEEYSLKVIILCNPSGRSLHKSQTI